MHCIFCNHIKINTTGTDTFDNVQLFRYDKIFVLRFTITLITNLEDSTCCNGFASAMNLNDF